MQSELSADMPHGYDVRVHALCPPASDWLLMLRVHAVRVYTLDEYVEAVGRVNRKLDGTSSADIVDT
jgi:hypothetical protein